MQSVYRRFYLILFWVCCPCFNALLGQPIWTQTRVLNNRSPLSSDNSNPNPFLGFAGNAADFKLLDLFSQGFLDTVKEFSKNPNAPFMSVKIDFNKYSNNTKTNTKHKRQRVRACYELYPRNYQFADGCLVAVDSQGLYIYNPDKKRLGYIPSSKIRYVRKGLGFNDKILRDMVIAVGAGAVIGGLSGLGYGGIEYAFYYGFSGAITGLAFGPVLAIIPEFITHQYQNTLPDVKYFIRQDQQNWNRYLGMLNRRKNVYGTPLFYEDFPSYSINESLNQPVVAPVRIKTVLPSGEIVETYKDSAEFKKSMAARENSVTTVIPTQSTQPATVKQVETLPQSSTVVKKASFEENKQISVKWIITGFNPSKVNATKLINKLPELRNEILNSELAADLKNTDDVKFAAMYLLAQLGYDFTRVIDFTDEQDMELKAVLPFYNVEIVTENTRVRSKAVTQTDQKNLKFLYDMIP